MSNILINASNLHVGGGVAVATSFIHELSLLADDDNLIINKITIYVSSKLDLNLREKKTRTNRFRNYIVKDYRSIEGLFTYLNCKLYKYDTIFTVFGPSYFPRNKNHIVGFAQPWIAYPNNAAYKKLSFKNKVKSNIKFFIQTLFFLNSSELIVEHDHIKIALKKQLLFKRKNISVVQGTVDEVYYSPESYLGINFGSTNKKIKLGVISKNYPHKNLEVLVDVKYHLLKKYNVDAEFYVTLDDIEFSKCSVSFQKTMINVGPLTLNQCPTFYNEIDGVVFPSLLECFSAVPYESMIMKTPIFASDFPFIRQQCLKYAYYVNPLDPEDISEKINTYIENKDNFSLEDAHQFVLEQPSANERAMAYYNLCLSSIHRIKPS